MVYDALADDWYPAFQTVFRSNTLGAPISVSTAGNHLIIPGVANKSIRIVSLFFTVGSVVPPATIVGITLFDGDVAISGPMLFSGGSGPRGIVIPFPYSPLGLHVGNSFLLHTSVDVPVAGMACYFYQ